MGDRWIATGFLGQRRIRSRTDEHEAPPVPPGRAASVVPGTAALLGICLALAAASLALPAVLGYDPWAWLVWGRELTRGKLSTDGGPSWKPLPVLVTTVLAPFGGAAPDLWLLLVRAGGLFGLVLAYRLAARFAGPVAGTVAATALLLTPDAESRWLRHLLQGNVEPLLVALCLWAVQRHLDGRHGQAVLLGAAAALLRPEVWPLLALYTGWLLWREPRWRVVPALGAVPLAWFGADWWTSGDPWRGAETARVLSGTWGQRLVTALDRIADVVIAPVWAAAAVCVVVAVRRRTPAPVVLAAGALAWMAVVAAMAAVYGYAALSRFLALPAAVLCVLTGIATAIVVTAPRRAALRWLVAAALLAAALPSAAPRTGWLAIQLSGAAADVKLRDDLDRAIALAGGRDAVLGCGVLAVDTAEVGTQWLRPALSWQLDVSLARVEYGLASRPGVAVVRTGSSWAASLRPVPAARPLAQTNAWIVYAVRCPQ